MPIPDVGTSKGIADPPSFNDIDVIVPQTSAVAWPSMERNFRTLGWSEHVLPDNFMYYSHRDLRVVTDVDLRNSKKLHAITEYLDRKHPFEIVLPPLGWELWLRDDSKLAYEFIAVKAWVNHRDRLLTLEPPTQAYSGSSPPTAEDDRETIQPSFIVSIRLTLSKGLDVEYRYWTYIEAHPAHEPLAPSAYAEAMDTLTWCYTGKTGD